MLRILRYAVLPLLIAASARAFDEASIADRNLEAMIVQLETGDWNARIHAVHEFDYMQNEGLTGLALATEDGDWQVRMTAVHSLSNRGEARVPILKRLLKHEPCPVVRLMTLHSLGSLGPEGEEEKAMRWTFGASNTEVNACRDQAGPGRAPWVLGKRPSRVVAAASRPSAPEPKPAPPPLDPRPRGIPFTPPEKEAAATRGPEPMKPRGKPETLASPTKIQRHIELEALLDLSTASVARPGVSLAMRGRSTTVPENLPLAVGLVPREHGVDAPGLIMADAGSGKMRHDALPGLLGALKRGDVRTRARAADDLGQLGTKASPAIPALMVALRDRSPRVRSSAGLALGNIGAADAGVVPMLIEALRDRSEDVRYAAALALSRIDSPEARAAFTRHVGKEARRAIDRRP